METNNNTKNKKPLIIGIIVAVVVIAIIFLLIPKGSEEDTTVKEAVKNYLLDENINDANEVFLTYTDTLEVVSADELSDVLLGNFFLQMDCKNQYWTVEYYTEEGIQQVAFLEEKVIGGRWYENTSEKNYVDEYEIKDGCVVKEWLAPPKEGELLGDNEIRNFQLRKVCDDVYISYRLDDNGSVEGLDAIMILRNQGITDKQYEKAVNDVKATIEDIIVNYLGLELEDE
ncbi:MAG: hypothetical protein IJH28_01855 [Mogibacterium sp.]|nr:hypothetical protein [Mogibacterium sp.]